MSISKTSEIKQRIIKRFFKKVRGKLPDTSKSNINHDGKGGHWLEVQMGVKHNANNAPDIEGFEMKNSTSHKTTFGDWSADYYIFKDPAFGITRSKFLKIFGKPNLKKGGRYSWSGSPCPRVDKWNEFGQKLVVDKKGNIFGLYNYSKDQRKDKLRIVPKKMQIAKLVLVKWEAKSIQAHLEDKYNQRGWFKCEKDTQGRYSHIVFGAPMVFKIWIRSVREGLVFFDSGMYEGNSRMYSQWRANNNYWEKLIISRY